MKRNKIELIFITLAILAVVVTIGLIDDPAGVLAAGNYGQKGPALVHYPNPHPTPQAPVNFPWLKMPTLPVQSYQSQVPPPFSYPIAYPGPTSYPGLIAP